MKKFVIIVAGGKGSRMLSDVPKQFHVVSGKPLLMHTLNCFYTVDPEIKIILVLPQAFIDFWKSLVERYDFKVPHQIIQGGKNRYQSVKNGLKFIRPECLVSIHDGVRPLVSRDTIKRVFETAQIKGNAIPVVSIHESLRRVEHNKNSQVDRNQYYLVQTPQCFRAELLLNAYEQKYQDKFTDDATLVENMGEALNLVEGNYENIKITHPVDLKIAKALLS